MNRIKDGRKVPEGFVYSSDTNPDWMTSKDLQNWINENEDSIGKI